MSSLWGRGWSDSSTESRTPVSRLRAWRPAVSRSSRGSEALEAPRDGSRTVVSSPTTRCPAIERTGLRRGRKRRPAGPPQLERSVSSPESLRQCDLDAELRKALVGTPRRRRDASTACGCTSIHNASFVHEVRPRQYVFGIELFHGR